MRVYQQPAFVLINRPYSESSWISEIFCRDYGRLALMAKGARRFKSPVRGVLLPFQPLLVSWSGKGEVPTLTSAEIQASDINLFEQDLQGDALICGFYCNELISYLLHRHDPHPNLFTAYQSVVSQLYAVSEHGEQRLSALLRQFEQTVIRETGYEVNFDKEAGNGHAIAANRHYQYIPGEGFHGCEPDRFGALSGRVIMSLQENSPGRLSGEEIATGKQLMRAILRHSLGEKSIHSRALFVRSLGQKQERSRAPRIA